VRSLEGLDYYDPKRQDNVAEHGGCVVEDGERYFGHGMICRRPALHDDPFPYAGEHGSRHAYPGTLNGKPLAFAPREMSGGAA
jgi:hypothetical protein